MQQPNPIRYKVIIPKPEENPDYQQVFFSNLMEAAYCGSRYPLSKVMELVEQKVDQARLDAALTERLELIKKAHGDGEG